VPNSKSHRTTVVSQLGMLVNIPRQICWQICRKHLYSVEKNMVSKCFCDFHGFQKTMVSKWKNHVDPFGGGVLGASEDPEGSRYFGE
jgi:hypothetical protein